MITRFGSCRISCVSNFAKTSGLHELNFPHSTKEIIQFIKFINNEENINYPNNIYCFRGALINKNTGGYDLNTIEPITWKQEYKDQLFNSNTCVIEISSNRIIKFDEKYIHHLLFEDKIYAEKNNNPLREAEINYLSKEDVEQDIIEIKKLLNNKLIFFVSHFDAKYQDKPLKRRHDLICSLEEICKKHNLLLFNPEKSLNMKYNQSEILTQDLGHYTELGEKVIGNNLYQFMRAHGAA